MNVPIEMLTKYDTRLDALEKCMVEIRPQLSNIEKIVNKIDEAIVGSRDGEKRGIWRRLEIVEGRAKKIMAACGVIGIALLGAIAETLASIFLDNP